MEHISRLTTNNIDLLIVVSDPTHRGIQAAARIVQLTDELRLCIGRKVVIVNQASEEKKEAIERVVKDYNLELVGMVPEDPLVRDFDLNGTPTIELGKESCALRAAYQIFEKLLEN